jgi:hypothetical protein
MSSDKRIRTSDENIEKQMQGRVLEDFVRSCMVMAIDGADDAEFYEVPNADWIAKYTRKGASAFGYKNRDFQVDILNDPAHHKVVMKSAQMGISEIMARDCICRLCKNDRTKALYTLPTDSDVGIFSDTRVRPIFEDSPYITRWSGKGTDNLGRKQVKNSFLILRGSWDVRLAQMMDIDFIYIDEFDRQKPDIIGSLRARMDGSAYRYETDYSTPTVEGYGIHPLYLDTDQKEWYVTCQRCGEEQFITEEHIMFYQEDEEHLEPYFGCLRCKNKLNRFVGQWKPTAKGKPNMSGYHISQAMSPMISAADIIHKKETSQLEADYYNYTWGLPYRGTAEGSMESIDYGSLVGDFGLDPDSRTGGKAIMSIDWGLPWSWAEIRRINEDSPDGDIVWIECFKSTNPDDHPDRMIDLARQSEACMVMADIGYSDSRGYRLKQALGDIFWEVASNSTGVVEPRFNLKNHHVVCFKERILKRHFVLLKNKRIYLPQDSDKIKFGKDKSKTRVEMWLEHHKNIKIRKNRDGVEEMVYSGQDHLALTSAYCDIAFEYILKNTSTTKRTQRKVKVHRVGRG